MATKKKEIKRRPRPRHPPPEESEAVHERIVSLGDAARAAVASITDHAGEPMAVAIVQEALCTLAAFYSWHGTADTEEDFVRSARQSFRRIAQAHADCERGKPDPREHKPVHRPEDLN